MKFIFTAEHCNGESVEHPCTSGIYSDPVDDWQSPAIEADSLDIAETVAWSLLTTKAENAEACCCRRKRQPGSEAWHRSVTLIAWPCDVAAAVAMDAEGHKHWRSNHYGIVPQAVLIAVPVAD